MSNVLSPVRLVPYPEAPGAMMPEAVSPELLAPSPVADVEVSGSALSRLAGYAGDLATKAVIYTQIKTSNAIEAVSGAVASTKDHLKRDARNIAARTSLAVLVLTGGGLANFLETQNADAASGPPYKVTNFAAGGVFARNSPHTNDTQRTPGYGVYPGQTLDLLCGVTDGDRLGRNNTTWHYVSDENNPGEGDFWVSDHYLNTPNLNDQLAPGEARCANESSNPVQQNVNSQPASPAITRASQSCKYDNGAIALKTLVDTAKQHYGLDEGGPLAAYEQQWHTRGNEDTVICVAANLGDPDYANHRQYVGTVSADVPRLEESKANCGWNDTLMEVWGDGFYQATDCTNTTSWHINKWLKNGTYVCAAISSKKDYARPDGWTPIIGDEVQYDGPLGEADPYRDVTCFQIKA